MQIIVDYKSVWHSKSKEFLVAVLIQVAILDTYVPQSLIAVFAKLYYHICTYISAAFYYKVTIHRFYRDQ